MSFIKRAREVAEAAAEQAHHAASLANRAAADPTNQERFSQGARSAVGAARRGMSTVVERIDPGVLADLIIKATALQEQTNRSLREKHSVYRISELSISASIPPGISFAIGRIDDVADLPTGDERASAELVARQADPDDDVISLEGMPGSAEQLDQGRASLADVESGEVDLTRP